MRGVVNSPFKSNALILPFMVAAFFVTGCDSETDGQDTAGTEQPSTQTSPAEPSDEAQSKASSTETPPDDIRWFNRGGNLNRASTLQAWRIADEEERLRSAADLLKMKAGNLPAPQEAAQMARDLAARITEAADAGEQGTLGPIVDRVAEEMKW